VVKWWRASDAVAAGIRAYDGGATSLADALRYKGNLQWDQCLMAIFREGRLSEEVFRANTMNPPTSQR